MGNGEDIYGKVVRAKRANLKEREDEMMVVELRRASILNAVDANITTRGRVMGLYPT